VTNRIVWHIAACVTALTLFPTTSGAQSSATTFDELRLAVKDGDQVAVTDSDGRRTRGKIAKVTASSLDLAIERSKFVILREHSQRTFTDTDVTRVTRIDSMWQGGVIGSLVGFVSGVVGPIPRCSGTRRNDIARDRREHQQGGVSRRPSGSSRDDHRVAFAQTEIRWCISASWILKRAAELFRERRHFTPRLDVRRPTKSACRSTSAAPSLHRDGGAGEPSPRTLQDRPRHATLDHGTVDGRGGRACQ
jgi:hypothetical protein